MSALVTSQYTERFDIDARRRTDDQTFGQASQAVRRMLEVLHHIFVGKGV